MKSFILLSLLLIGNLVLKAQPPTHIPLMNDTWKLIAERSYKKNADYKMVPAYPAKLKVMQNKVIELPGYMIPLKTELDNTDFMLAVVPYDQCPYCGQGDIPMMIEVKMVTPIRYSDKPVKIRGKLLLNETGDDRSEIFLVDAELIK